MVKKIEAPFNFEASLTQLNQLVETMENGQLNLESSIQQFELGIKLTRQCQQALQIAEQKVQILMEKSGNPILENFNEPE